MIKIEYKVGDTHLNSNNTLMKIVEYNSPMNVVIEFQDEHKFRKKTYIQNFKKGDVRNPYDKTVYDIAYLGDGDYKVWVDNHKTDTYGVWHDMVERCYNEKTRHAHMAYKDCTVCNEWLNYQTFCKWYYENYYSTGEGRMHLDKDILVKNNRIYSPETCIFVPQRINMMFIHQPNKLGLPTGMTKSSKGYRTLYNGKLLGIYINLDKALEAYMKEKRLHIKQVADEYKNKIPNKLYKALYAW